MTGSNSDPPPKVSQEDWIEKECELCGESFMGVEIQDLCVSCREEKGFASIETPEGGWPKGSDMDRI